MFLVFNEIKYALKTVELSVNYCLFIIISHGEILKLPSILVHAKFWSVGNFPEFYSSGYIFIYFIVSIFPIYSRSDLPNYVLHVGCRCPWRGWSSGSLLQRQFEPPTWAFRLGQPLGFHKSYQRLASSYGWAWWTMSSYPCSFSTLSVAWEMLCFLNICLRNPPWSTLIPNRTGGVTEEYHSFTGQEGGRPTLCMASGEMERSIGDSY